MTLNNFNDLVWKDAPHLQFDNKNIEAKGSFKKGRFTQQSIKQFMTKMSKDAYKKGKRGQLSVSIHYKHINKWMAGKLFMLNEESNTFNPYNEMFEDDQIDGIQIYYIGSVDAKYKGTHLSGKQSSFFTT